MELFHFLGVKEIPQQSIFSFTVRKHMGGSEPDQLFQMMQWVDPTPSCPWVCGQHLSLYHVASDQSCSLPHRAVFL